MTRCPAHDDRHASLSVARGSKGVVVHCHTGCTHQDIAAVTGLPVTDWFIPEVDAIIATQPPVRQPDPLPTIEQIAAWANALHAHGPLCDRIHAVKGWTRTVMLELGVGWDGERIVFPILDDRGELATIARYLPGAKPKMLGLPGRPRGLFPNPERHEPSKVLWLVEGEPDGVTTVQLGLAGTGVPGVNGWHTDWLPRFTDRNIVICCDCDQPGRDAATRLAKALAGTAADVRIVDLDPARDDGFDITDFFLAGGTKQQLCELAKNATPIHGLRAA
jgi:putative DNA primase/helicase